MKIRMLTYMSGPNIQRARNEEIDVPSDEAARLISAGFAEPIRGATRETTSRRIPRETTAKSPDLEDVAVSEPAAPDAAVEPEAEASDEAVAPSEDGAVE